MSIPVRTYWRLLVNDVRPHWRAMAVLGLLLLAGIALQLISPQILRSFVDMTPSGGAQDALTRDGLLFLGVALLQQAASVGATYIGEQIGRSATNALRADLPRHTLRLAPRLSLHSSRSWHLALRASLLALTLAACASPAAPTPAAPAPTPAATATTGPAATATLPAGMFVNPVLDRDFPDPDVLTVDGTYYAFATNGNGHNIQTARSTDLVHWDVLADALPKLPDWAVPDFGWAWAPDVTTFDGQTYLMYFTARFAIGQGGTQCIGLASSEKPEGPYTPIGDSPFICQTGEGGSIDAASFVDGDGTPWLLWKNDGNSGGGQAWIYLQQLTPDGQGLVGEPTRLITADQRWEGILVEGPTLWRQDDRYVLFYSANDYASPKYATGVAVADAITGPYEKVGKDAFLATTIPAGIVGPGGQDIVVGPGGDTWIVFHGWSPGAYRRLYLAPLQWSDGLPILPALTREPGPMP